MGSRLLGSEDPERGFKKGDLKFTLHGDKLQGGWVLVRMKHDRNGGKRTNWLLIKHRDEYAKEGEANDILDEDRSVASGRSMAQIAKGKGKAPKPFMLAKGRRQPTRCGIRTAAMPPKRAKRKTAACGPLRRRKRAHSEGCQAEEGSAMPGFRSAATLHLRRAAAPADGWCHEIKFDGYRVQLRVEDGRAR